MADSSDANALILQVSADVSKLQKQFAKATGIVNSGSKAMEVRAQQASSTIEKYFGKTDIGRALDKVFDRSKLAVFESGAAKIPIFGSAIEALGPAGVAAAVGIAAITAAGEAARKSMEWADTLDKTAKTLGTTTDSLQKFDYAAVASSIGLEQGRQALGDFNAMIGKFETHNGDGRMIKWADSIHLTRDEVNKTVDPIQKLALVMEHIATLSDPQSRAGAAKAFGLEALLPVINSGKEGIDQFIAKMGEARSAGGVIDAGDIKRAAEMNDQVEALTYLIGQDFHRAFIDLAPAIENVASFIERCTSALADFIGEIPQAVRGIEDLLSKIPHLPKGIHVDLGDAAKSPLIGTPAGAIGDAIGGAKGLLDELAARGRAADMADKMKGLGHVDFSGTDLDPNLGKPGHQTTFDKAKKDHTPTDQNQKTLDELAGQQAEAQKAIVANMLDWVKTFDPAAVSKIDDLLDQQAAAEMRVVDAANAKQKEDLLAKAKKGEITQATAIEAGLAADSIAIDKKLLIAKKTEQDKAKALSDADNYVLAQRREIAGILESTASINASMALTDADRRKIQLQSLALEQKLLSDQIDKDQRNDPLGQTDNKSYYDSKRAATADNNAAQVASVMKATQGPIKDYQDSLVDLNKQFQSFAVEGVKGLSDALAQALFDSKNFGSSVVNVFKQLFAQILSAEIQKTLFAPILSAIGLGLPAVAKASGGWINGPGTSTSDSIPARLSKGEFVVNAKAANDYGPLLEKINSGAKGFSLGGFVTPNQTIGSLSGGYQRQPIYIDRTVYVTTDASPYFDTHVQNIAAPIAGVAGATAVAGARYATPADMRRQARQQLF